MSWFGQLKEKAQPAAFGQAPKEFVAAFLVGILLALVVFLLWPSGNPPKDPRSAAEQYIQNLIDGNWRGSCDLLTASSREKLEEDARRSCPEILESSYASLGQLGDSPEITSLRQQKGWAVARSDLLPSSIFLQKTSSGWMISFEAPASRGSRL